MRTLFDLPAHAFFIHLPLVAVPLLAAASVVLVFRRNWWGQGGTVLAVATFIAAASTILAARSGNEFNDAIRDRVGNLADDHQALGETTVWWTIAFFVAATGFAAVQRIGATRDRVVLHRGALGLTALLGVLATIWMIRTGHEGASIVWDGVVE